MWGWGQVGVGVGSGKCGNESMYVCKSVCLTFDHMLSFEHQS